jgi:hypothetical protein
MLAPFVFFWQNLPEFCSSVVSYQIESQVVVFAAQNLSILLIAQDFSLIAAKFLYLQMQTRTWI